MQNWRTFGIGFPALSCHLLSHAVVLRFENNVLFGAVMLNPLLLIPCHLEQMFAPCRWPDEGKRERNTVWSNLFFLMFLANGALATQWIGCATSGCFLILSSDGLNEYTVCTLRECNALDLLPPRCFSCCIFTRLKQLRADRFARHLLLRRNEVCLRGMFHQQHTLSIVVWFLLCVPFIRVHFVKPAHSAAQSKTVAALQ